MERAVAVTGVGQTKYGRREDVNYQELVYEAIGRGLEDAGITLADIDAIVYGTMPSAMEGMNAVHLYQADALGAFGKPLMRVATCGTTGMSVAHAAFYHVASGMFDVVMAVGSEKMFENDPQGTMNTVFEPFFQRPFLGGAPALVGIMLAEYGYRYNIPEERLIEAAARLSVNHHTNALDNPYAHLKMKMTVEDAMKARIIAYPIRLSDCCPSSDGACVVIFASEEKAKKFPHKPAWVKGLAYIGFEHFYGDYDSVYPETLVVAAKKAYSMAGVSDPRKDIDVFEFYNPFTYQELTYYEAAGLCDKGEACKLVEDGVVLRRGKLPCSPSGGILCTNAIGASALMLVGQAALQVAGRADKCQIPGAKTALSHGFGGNNYHTFMILGSEL